MSNSAIKAIEFALTLSSFESHDFLNMWMHGDFPEIRENWPNCPEQVFIGDDPLHPKTKEQASDFMGFSAKWFDALKEEISIESPKGNLVTLRNKGSLEKRMLFELGETIMNRSCS